MTVVRIHYDGWLALPPVVRRRLGLKTGDELEVVATEDGVLLRHKAASTGARPAEPAEAPVSAEEVPPTARTRRTTRTAPPKTGKQLHAEAALPPTLKARGKRPRPKVRENGTPSGGA